MFSANTFVSSLGQTKPKGNGSLDIDGSGADDDFLTRERALLGDDAAQFTSGHDNTAKVEDGDDDLLGGSYDEAYSSGQHGGEGVTEFESSFPAIDTSNNVCVGQSQVPNELQQTVLI